MLARLRRKFTEVRRYPALAATAADRQDLRALGLWRTRVLSAANAIRLTRTGQAVLMPGLRATHGEPIRVTIGDFNEIDCFDELFVDCIYNLEEVPFEPDLVVDCGAFRGYFSALAVGAFPEASFTCFEPNPEHQSSLHAQLALLSRPVEQFATAVGTADGAATFAGHGMGGALVEGASQTDDTLTVSVINFPRWLTGRSPQRLVWKLDVEGAEATLLPATLACLPASTAIFLETHYNDELCAGLLDPYRAAGFTIREVRRRSAQGFAYIEWFLVRHRPI